jgi:hypothetical protein
MRPPARRTRGAEGLIEVQSQDRESASIRVTAATPAEHRRAPDFVRVGSRAIWTGVMNQSIKLREIGVAARGQINRLSSVHGSARP